MNAADFQRFYEGTASALRAYLRLKCRDVALADDVLQESYLRLLRRELPELHGAQLKSYLYRTAHSALADHYRARERERRWRTKIVPIDGVEPPDEPSSVGPLELPPDMQRVFESLEPRKQSLLWLAYVEGFKHEEIARIVGVKAASVRVLLSRARADLATKLAAEGLAPVAAQVARR